jgi:LuxR family maltose regulon positive regulatory protein
MSWIEQLPDEYVQKSAIIILIKAVCYTGMDNFEKAWQCVGSAELLINNEAFLHKPAYTELLLTKANLYYRTGDIKNLPPTLNKAATSSATDSIHRSYTDFNFFEISAYRAPTENFIKALRQNPGIYHSFIRDYRRIITINPGYAPLVEGEFYYESGKLDEALPKLIASADEAVNANCLGALVPAMVTMAKIRRAKGDIRGALEVVGECQDRVAKLHKPHWNYLLKAFKMRLYIDMNHDEMLDKWLIENKLSVFQDNIRTHEYELIVLARVLIRKKRYDDANILLTRLLSFAEGQKRNHSIVEIANLFAITAMKNLNEEMGEKYLEKALSIGIGEGYVRSFVDELAPMVSLLATYTGSHKKATRLTAYAKKLLSLTKEAVRHSMLPAGLGPVEEHLTSMEKKVLQLLINACTNNEIAGELGITLRTVKAHTGSIYKKLGVKTRAQCIKKVVGTTV